MPAALEASTVHEAYDYGYGAGAKADEGPAAPLAAKKRAASVGGGSGPASQQQPGDEEPGGSQVGWVRGVLHACACLGQLQEQARACVSSCAYGHVCMSSSK